MLALDFVINVRAARVQAEPLEQALRARFSHRELRFHRDPNEVPLDAAASSIVVAAGGDGTVSRVLNTIGERLGRFAVLPLGTSNDLATHVGVPRSVAPACDLIEAERFRAVDLIQVNDWRMATCGGIGFAVDVAAQANRWKASRLRPLIRLLGPLVYPIAAVRQFAAGRKVIKATLTIDGKTEELPLSIAMVSNQPRFGKRFCTSPNADNAAGLLHLGVFGPARGVFDMPRIATQIYLARPNSCPEARQLQAREFTLSTAEPVPFFADGEVLGVADRFVVRVQPGALRIAGPPVAGLRAATA